jgi:hypothetical protein
VLEITNVEDWEDETYKTKMTWAIKVVSMTYWTGFGLF